MQPRRIKQLRMSFGLAQQAMAERVGASVEQLRAWETGREQVPPQRLAAIAERFGLSLRWLMGEDAPKWGSRVQELQRWLAEEMLDLRGMRFVEMLRATTGERIAYAVNLLRRADPYLFTEECIACWLGLSLGSTRLLLSGELDPGTPVITRASELTGLPERWFRAGPSSEEEK